MKKLKFYPLLLLTILSFSCSNDNDDNGQISGQLIATINNEQMVFNEAFYFYEDNYVSIGARSNSNNGNTHIIQIIMYSDTNTFFEEGTYNFSDGIGKNADDYIATYGIVDQNDNLIEAYSTSPDLNIPDTSLGELTITNFNNGIVSGTFNFKAFNENGSKTITLTEGSFTNLTERN